MIDDLQLLLVSVTILQHFNLMNGRVIPKYDTGSFKQEISKRVFYSQAGDELVGLHCFRHLSAQLNTAMESVNRYFSILDLSPIINGLSLEVNGSAGYYLRTSLYKSEF